MAQGVGMATSLLDDMLMSSIKALSQDNCIQEHPYKLPAYVEKPHM